METEPVPDGKHRFELVIFNNVRPEAEMKVPGLPYTLHPAGESPAAECWYVDLEPGIHPISYRIAPEDGRHVRLGLEVNRYGVIDGPEGPEPHWYPVMNIKCGEGGNECTPDDMRDWLARHRADPKAMYDPVRECRVPQARVGGERAPQGRGVRRPGVHLQPRRHATACEVPAVWKGPPAHRTTTRRLPPPK